MKTYSIRIIWGVILVSMGAVYFADLLGYVNFALNTPRDLMISFAVLAAAFFLSYLLNGYQHWGCLFPTLIFTNLAFIIGTLLNDPDSPTIVFPFLISIAIPFYIGYLVNRRQWGLLVPAWVLTVISTLPILANGTDPELLASLFLYAVALPFLVGFLADHRRIWALITAAVLGFMGIVPLIELLIHGDLLGPVIVFLFSLPFLATYTASRKNWWAAIPSGIFISIGLVALLDYLFPYNAYIPIGDHEIGAYSGVLFLGLAVTFGVLWSLRASEPTGWARYPAIALLVTSGLAFVLGRNFQIFLPVVILLVIGSVLVLAAFFKGRVNRQPTS